MQLFRSIRTRAALIAGAIAVIATVSATFVVANYSDASAAEDTPTEYSTVEVQHQDLTVEHKAVGAVETLTTIDIESPINGTVLSTMSPGATISAGAIIATVDDHVVVAIDGTTPMYRDLTVGDEGPDVAQLEAALVEFGLDPYASITVDDQFTTATAALVKAWQVSLGIDETGVVNASNVVALSEPMRVTTVLTTAGTQVAESDPIVTLATQQRVVTALVPVADATTLGVGDAVVLRLPDRTELDGTVQAVTLGTNTAVRSVVVTIDDPEVMPSLDGLTIDISWTDVVLENASTIPADVFRHLDNGSYVVDVLAADGTISAVPAVPGAVVGSLVEVTGISDDAQVIRP